MGTPKTNAMRILEKEKISYQMHTYDASDGQIDGAAVARKVGMDPAKVFKTLVTQGHSGNYFVCVLPVEHELNLKKAAKVFGEKSLEMIPVAKINAVTGYIRGGCSPIGMKKSYRTVFDCSAQQQETMVVSGGKIGFQIEAKPDDLLKACGTPVKRKTINEWRRRGIIQPIASQDGKPVYRLWDVWQAAHRNDNQQAKEEDHISDGVAA